MNFDDLHDPDPPRAGIDTLAAVAGRAQQIRRRRTAMVTAGGLFVAVAVIVPAALVATGGESEERLAPASVPTTVAPATAPPEAVETTTSTTTVPVGAPPALVAVDANGDAVYITPDGVQTVLHDGADPDEQPTEGDTTIVDGVAVTSDCTRAWVSTCCEPVPGSWQEIALPSGDVVDSGYGHGFDLRPAGDLLVNVSYYALEVRGLDGQIVAGHSFQDAAADARDPYSAAWVGDDALAVIELANNEFRLVTTNGALDGYVSATGVAIGTDIQAPWPVLAGVAQSGSILVFQGEGEQGAATASALQAYDPTTLERVPTDDVTLPALASHAWMQDGVLTWIDPDRVLHVGDTVVPGEFVWARPA